MKHLILLLFPICVYAQLSYEREWATYVHSNPNNSTRLITSACAVENGNLLFTDNVNDVYSIFKFSSDGQPVWEFTMYNNPDENILEGEFYFEDVKMDHEGNYVFCGFTNQSHDIATPNAWQEEIGGGVDRFLGKLSPVGNLIWCTYLGGEADDWGEVLFNYDSKVEFTTENEIIWHTEILSDGLGTPGTFQSNRLDAKHIISKFDSNGQRVWSTYYGADGNLTNLSGMKINDQGIWLAGQTSNSAYYDSEDETWTQGNSFNIYISQFNYDGNRIASRYYDLGDALINGACLVLSGNSLYVTGRTNSSQHGTPGAYNEEPTNGGLHNFLTRIEMSGNIDWTTYLAETIPEVGRWWGDEVSTLSMHSEKLFVTSHTNKTDIVATSNGFQQENMGESDIYARIFSPAGELLWGTFYGGTEMDRAFSPFIAPFDGGFYLIGATSSTSGISTPGAYQETFSGNIADVFIVKFIETTLTADDIITDTKIRIYPNPVNDILNIQSANPVKKISVKDMQGKLIQTASNTNKISLASLPKAMYLVQVKTDAGLFTKKVLK